jgi:hypothetical protein
MGEDKMKGFLIFCGVISSLVCLIAGIYLLDIKAVGENSIIEALAHGIGIYFIAKAFFLGPVLWFTASRSLTQEKKPEDQLNIPAVSEKPQPRSKGEKIFLGIVIGCFILFIIFAIVKQLFFPHWMQ